MTEDSEREEIEKLLPWYVTGKLGYPDASKVDKYLAQHPDVLSQLQLIGTERQETMRANEAMGWPGSGMSDRLMASLPRGATPSRSHGRFAKFGRPRRSTRILPRHTPAETGMPRKVFSPLGVGAGIDDS